MDLLEPFDSTPSPVQMYLDRGRMWRVLLLTFLAVAAAAASQDQQPEVEVSDFDDDLGLDEEELKVLMSERGENEEEEDEEEEMTMGKGHPVEDSANRKAETDANVSFQVREALSMSLQCALRLLFWLTVMHSSQW